jgi:NAD(P)-dependent dehydrogenase (short-subunit alcohol dehydrogenase family)
MNENVALVTGAAQGIGRAVAERLAADGFRVVLADTQRDKGQAVAADLARGQDRARFVATDIGDEASCQALARAAIDAYGRIDALVHCAAITMFDPSPFWELSVAEWDRIMAVNARGTFLVTKAVAEPMRAAGRGSIVTFASNTFLSGRAGIAHYVASKGAVVGFTRTAARELGPHNVRVNCILPGSTETAERRERGMDPERMRFLVESQALKRTEVPADLTGAVAFLVSDDARFMTGQCLNVDGGFVLY